MDSDSILADLPPPDDAEPPSLRSDIADELLDHLQSAFRREVLKDGDEAAAEQRVLDRFGDPKKLARRLWWQAMWSRVMGKQILSGLQWLMSLAAIGLALMVVRQQMEILTEINAGRVADAHWRQNLSVTLNELRNRMPAPESSGTSTAMGSTGIAMIPGINETNIDTTVNQSSIPAGPMGFGGGDSGGPMAAGGVGVPHPKPPTLTVKLVYETADGPPVTDVLGSISLSGHQGIPLIQRGGPAAFPATSGGGFGAMPIPPASDVGWFAFYGLEPDRYELKIELHGQQCKQPVVIRDDQTQELTVICPKPRKKALVRVAMPPLPDDLQQAGYTSLMCVIREKPLTLGTTSWVPAAGLPEHQLLIDTNTGLLYRVHSGQWVDLYEDRVIFLPTGPIHVSYQMHPNTNADAVVVDPPQKDGVVRMIPLEIKPGENLLEVTLSDEFFAAARDQLASAKSARAVDDFDPIPKKVRKSLPDDPFGELPDPDLTPPGDSSQIRLDTVSVKLVREDGIAIIPDAAVDITARKLAWSLDHVLNTRQIEGGREQKFATGLYQVAGIKPDRYRLTVRLSDGQHFERPLLVRGDKPVELTFVCPPPRQKVAVQLSVPPLPEDLRQAGATLQVDVWDRFVEFKDVKWLNSESKYQQLDIDPQTGAVIRIGDPSGEMVDVSQAPPEDRAVFLSTGPMNVSYTISILTGPSTWIPVRWPNEDGKSVHHVKTDDDRWELKLPDELLKLAQEKLEKVKDLKQK